MTDWVRWHDDYANPTSPLGATVIWTRHRLEPDLTRSIRAWLDGSGFVEEAFHAPDDVLFSVGVARFAGRPRRLQPAGRLFTFVR